MCLYLAGAMVFGTGCVQKMADQPSYQRLEGVTTPGGRTSGPGAVPDTVPRGQVRDDAALFTGQVDGSDAQTFPFAIDRPLLERGQERFDIYCAVCHDRTGSGGGMIVRRGFTPPPSFHEDRLRDAPPGHFFDVITNGFGAMPSYAAQIPVRDRWLIVAYIRALQLSQHASMADVPDSARADLDTAGGAP